MMPAAKHLDPVLGIDIHVHIVPPGIPIPLPNPFIGVVLDLMDYLPIIGSTVLVNNMHRAQAGTEAKNIPHLPLFGPLVPPAGNEGEMFMGSATVNVDNEPFTYMALPVLSCQTIGFPAMPRFKKPRKTYSLLLPLSIVLPIPLGPPVLVGGPPTISLMVLGMKALFAGLGRAFKGLRKLQKGSGKIGQFFKKASKKFHKKAAKIMDDLKIPPSLRNKVHRGLCNLTGHPVDVATGKVLTEAVDFDGFGPFPFVFERVWFSTSTYRGPLGHGWHHAYDLALAVDLEEQVAAVRLADGRAVVFELPEEGAEVFDRAEKIFFGKDSRGYYTRQNGLRYRFGQVQGRELELPLLQIEDINGFSLMFQYGDEGWLEKVIDGSGRAFVFENDDAGRILCLKGPHPDEKDEFFTIASYRYGNDEDLIVVDDALNQPFTYYYENHLLIRETMRGGLSFHFEYEGSGPDSWCVRTWGDDNLYARKLTYDKVNEITTVVDSLGYSTTYFSSGGLVTNTIDAIGASHQISYDDDLNVVSEIDALGKSTLMEYDELANCVSQTESDGAVTSYGYDGEELVRFDDVEGEIWTIDYDEDGRVTSCTSPLGAETRYVFEGGLMQELIGPDGARTSIAYDRLSQPSAVVYPNGSKQKWEYDYLGRCVANTNQLGGVRRIKYDLLDRVIESIDEDGNAKSCEYSEASDLVRVKDSDSLAEFSYCGLRRLSSHSENGRMISFSYDTEEQLVGIRNEDGNLYQFQLDPVGRLLSESNCENVTKHFVRDPAGQILKIQRPGGLETLFEYDDSGRILQALYGRDAFDRFSYNKRGEILEASNQHSHVAFERDSLGRIIKETQNGMSVETLYGASGSKEKITSSLGADLSLTHDKMGEITGVDAIAGNAGWKATFERDAVGLELVRELPGGARCVWKRDALGRPLEQRLTGPQERFRSRAYSWGRNSRLEKVKDSKAGNFIMEYDPAGTLLETKLPDGGVEYRLPDKIGNIFKSETQEDRSFGKCGQLIRERDDVGWKTYLYDPEGNLLRKTDGHGRVWTYQWDSAGNLVEVMRPDGGAVTFTYDSFGRRLTKTFNGVTTCWLWDGNTMLHEWLIEAELPLVESEAPVSETGRKGISRKQIRLTSPSHGPPSEGARDLTTWVYEPGEFVPIAKLVGDESFSIVSDHIGVPIQMIASDGSVVWEVDRIDSYGRVRGLKGGRNDCPFRWQGQYVDVETDLHYNRFRYYDPGAGGYISQDPIGLQAANPTDYSYVHDVFGFIDPLGLAIIPKVVKDSGGRVTEATSPVSRADLGTGTNTNASSRGYARGLGRQTDDAGHMIGNQLGGSGGKKNVFPQGPNLNRGQFAQFEGKVADFVGKHGSADIKLEFEYRGNSTRPSKIRYTATAPDGTSMTKKFKNTCK